MPDLSDALPQPPNPADPAAVAGAARELVENYRRQRARLGTLPEDATPAQICAALTGAPMPPAEKQITAQQTREALDSYQKEMAEAAAASAKEHAALVARLDALVARLDAMEAAVGQWSAARVQLLLLDEDTATPEAILNALKTTPPEEDE